MRHGKYRPVYRVEATMRSEGTGTATTGSSHRQRRIAVEPCKQRRHKVGRTRFREGPPIGTPSPVHGGTTSPAPTRNSIPRLLVCLSPVPRPSLSRALTATTLPLLQRTVCAREQSDSGAATQWRRQLRVYAGFVNGDTLNWLPGRPRSLAFCYVTAEMNVSGMSDERVTPNGLLADRIIVLSER